MPVITLPDGSRREFDHPVTIAEVAQSIGPGLAKAALAGKVDGRLVDTSHLVDTDVALGIVTDKDPEGIDIYWGAYLGMPQQILMHGALGDVKAAISAQRQRARAEHGWIMDIYLLRRG